MNSVLLNRSSAAFLVTQSANRVLLNVIGFLLVYFCGINLLSAFVLEEVYAFPSGTSPRAALIEGPDKAFYGTTYAGGASGNGTVFRVTTDGVLTTLFSFGGTNGANPTAGLLWGNDGALYGTTLMGGAGGGTVFRLTTDGVFTNLVYFGVRTALLRSKDWCRTTMVFFMARHPLPRQPKGQFSK